MPKGKGGKVDEDPDETEYSESSSQEESESDDLSDYYSDDRSLESSIAGMSVFSVSTLRDSDLYISEEPAEFQTACKLGDGACSELERQQGLVADCWRRARDMVDEIIRKEDEVGAFFFTKRDSASSEEAFKQMKKDLLDLENKFVEVADTLDKERSRLKVLQEKAPDSRTKKEVLAELKQHVQGRKNAVSIAARRLESAKKAQAQDAGLAHGDTPAEKEVAASNTKGFAAIVKQRKKILKRAKKSLKKAEEAVSAFKRKGSPIPAAPDPAV